MIDTSLAQTSTEGGAALTQEMWNDAVRDLRDWKPKRHVCIIHPQGGVCMEFCGMVWVRDGDTYRPAKAEELF